MLTYHLGSIGDKRAIPVLKEAVIKGDSSVQASAYGALYRLGEFSFAELLGVVQGASDPWREIDQEVVGIIDEVRSRDSKRAIELYDRVIAELPEDSYAVANAHYWKISCYQDLKQYDRALLQCDALLKKTNFTNYTQQVPRMRAKIIKLAQEDTTLNE